MAEEQMSDYEHAQSKPIFVGVDGSATSIDAFRYAIGLASSLKRPLVAVAAWEPTRLMYDAYVPQPDWSPDADAKKVLTDAVDQVFGTAVPPWFSIRTLKGRPAAALIEASPEAEMLILGSRGHSGIAGMVLGSVSAACAAHAHCPVLIVHGQR